MSLGVPRRHQPVVASTMDEAAAWAAAGAPHGAVLTADHQTAGRGRRGRRWDDLEGQSLLASIVLRDLPAERLGLVPLAVGLATADAADALARSPHAASVKWPNDVLVEGRKLAGILTEARHGPDGAVVIVGLGVNVSQEAFPDALARRAVSLRQLGAVADREALLRTLLTHLDRRLDELATGPATAFVAAFEARMAHRGERVAVTSSTGGQTIGTALGIAPDGALRLLVDGDERPVYAGDVARARAAGTTLALDVGNSAVKAGRWDGDGWALARWPTRPDTPPDVWAARLAGLADGAARGGLVSVVPAVTAALDAAVRQLDVPEWRGPLRPETAPADGRVTPSPALDLSTAGADRFAAAAGAAALAAPGQSAVVVCAGTAVTVECVRAEGDRWVWLGGAIAPGPTLLRRSLPDHTAALPLVDWPEGTPAPTGRTTPLAMQAGLAGLYAGGVAELVSRAARELPDAPLVLATGGWAPWLAEHTRAVDRVEPTLILDGVRELVT